MVQHEVDLYAQAARDLATVRDVVRWGASQFNGAGLVYGHGTDNAWDEAAAVVLWAIATPWERLPEILDARLTGEEKERVVALFRRRVDERVPVAYLTGEAWFAGLRFIVDQRVLVPRSPLAELVGVGFHPWLADDPKLILDLCTGSGCIGIACAYEFTGAQVDLCDVDEGALEVARRNVDDHHLADRVRTIRSDGFEQLGMCKYDLIVSNPPYVDASEMARLPREFQAEPMLGLASGKDGLDFTRRLLREARAHLNDGGLLVVEVGNSAEALEKAFPKVPFFWPDLEFGGHGVFILNTTDLDAYAADFA